MPNRRIIYICDSNNVKFFTTERYGSHEYSFYEFHDELTDKNVIITYNFNSKFSNKIITNQPIFASVELFYKNIIIEEANVNHGRITSRLITPYFNPRLLSAKQIEKFKDQNPEFFI